MWIGDWNTRNMAENRCMYICLCLGWRTWLSANNSRYFFKKLWIRNEASFSRAYIISIGFHTMAMVNLILGWSASHSVFYDYYLHSIKYRTTDWIHACVSVWAKLFSHFTIKRNYYLISRHSLMAFEHIGIFTGSKNKSSGFLYSIE